MKKVIIYCWTYCPYCNKAKALLEDKGIAYEEIIIDNDAAALKSLQLKTGSGTVPQIFVDDVFIGGCDELYQLDNRGKFDEVFSSI